MASSGKRKTTMAKLAREGKLRERRIEKQAKKAARKLASAEQRDMPDGHSAISSSEAPGPPDSQAAAERAVRAIADS
jgi:hypothetical protein